MVGDLREKDPVDPLLFLPMVGSVDEVDEIGRGDTTLLTRPFTWVMGVFREVSCPSSWLTWVSRPRSRELDRFGEIEALTPASPLTAEELELPPPMLLLVLRLGLIKPPDES